MTLPGSAARPLDRRRAPTGRAVEALAFPAFERHVLSSGLTVYLAPRRDSPLALIEYVSRAGATHEVKERSGLATLAAGLLDEGTRRRSAEQLALDVESLGAWIAAGADWDSSAVSLGGLQQHCDRLTALCSEVVLEPAFDPQELERARRRRLADIERQWANAGSMAYLALTRTLFGDGDFGRPLIGNPEAVAEITADDCLAFWTQGQRAGSASVLVAGAIEPESVLAWIEERFAGLKPGAAAPSPRSTPDAGRARAEGTRRIVLVDRPNAAQSELRVGCVGIERGHPDRPALVLLSSLLGGKFTSRINLNLRERHGFTYGAHSRFIEHRDGGLFVVSAAVDTASVGAAASEVLNELERLCQEPVPDDELADTRSYVKGVFPYTLQTLQGLLSRLEQLATFRLADDYFDRLLVALDGVSPPELLALAQTHLDPSAMQISVAGPAAQLRSQLEQLGEVEDAFES